MKKRFVPAFLTSLITLLFVLAGCGNGGSYYGPPVELAFRYMDIKPSWKFLAEYDTFFVYLPVVSNMKISEPEHASSAILSYPKDPGIELKPEQSLEATLNIAKEQDRMNVLYRNWYISFVKLEVKIREYQNVGLYDKLLLTDTEISVAGGGKRADVPVFSDYAEVFFDAESGAEPIDWRVKLNILETRIKSELIMPGISGELPSGRLARDSENIR